MTKPTPDDRVDTATTDFDVSSILDNLPDLMFVLSRSAVIHHVNHHKDLLQPRDKIIGRPLHQLIQRPIAEQVQAAILRALDTGQRQRFEYELTVAGEKRHYAAMVSPLSKDTVTAVSRDVTHEHELQTALAGQRDFLERIFASDVVAVTVLNDEGQLVYANAEAEHVLGLVVASKDQRTVTYNDPAWLIESVDGEPFPETSLPFVRVKTQGEPVQDVRHAIVWPDGTRKVLSINGSVLRTDAQGRREYVFAVRDITRESAIQSQLHRLSLVASQTTNAVIMTDVQGRITWVNDGFTRISGYGSEESQGHKPADLLQGPGTDPETIRRMSVALQHRRPFQEDILNYHKNGTPYWLRISCNPLYDDNGQLQGFMAIESDVSREKSDAERIRDNERRLAAVIAGTRIGTWEWNVQTGETVFNERWAEMVGYTLQELEPISIDTWMRLAHPEDLAESEALLNQHFSGQSDFYDCKARMRHKDGHWIWVHDRGRVVTWTSDGQPLLMSGTHADITEQKRTEQMKDDFLSTVSHELRTPLTAISGALRLVNSGVLGELPVQVREMLSIAQNNSDRLGLLINDLLDMEKLSTGRLSVTMETQPLVPIIEAAIRDNCAYAESFSVTLRWVEPETDPEVHVDAHRLQQVLANLLSNAAKFSPEGSEVALQLTQEAGRVRVWVVDQGPGIAAGDLKRLFQKFSQLESTAKLGRKGTGLGLAISQALMEQMGGTVGVESQPGEGSRFYFELPLAETTHCEAESVDHADESDR